MTLLAKLYEAVESAEWMQSRLEYLEVDNKVLTAKVKELEAEIELLKVRSKVEKGLITESVNALNHGTSDEIMRLDTKLTRYLISSL